MNEVYPYVHINDRMCLAGSDLLVKRVRLLLRFVVVKGVKPVLGFEGAN